MTTVRIAFASLALSVAFAGVNALPAFAQTTSAPVCLLVSSNMRVGATDVATSGSVTALQNFLTQQGYFNSQYAGTGRFGPITYRAVVAFQAAQGLPATGYVGPLTRAAITRLGCGGGTTTHVSLYSVAPSNGQIGTVISLTGFGFTSNNTVLMDGSVAARNVPILSQIAIACTTSPSCHGGINQTIQFAIPGSLSPDCPLGSPCPMYMRQVTPGTYTVTVKNDNGTSNALQITVGSGSSGNLSITGIDAPLTLAIGQNGTWTVQAIAASNSGTLHYSVVWGDEQNYAYGLTQPQTSTVSTSATFTHSYGVSGRYTPRFTVTDDRGHTATVSSTITITPLY